MRRAGLSLFFLFLAACGGAQRGAEVPTTPLGQARAIEIIEQAIADRDYGAVSRDAQGTLSNGTQVNVDVLVRGLSAGFVYLNEQDRTDLGDAEIPEPAAASDLYVLLADLQGDERQLRVLIVQDTDFSYLLNPRANEREPEQRTLGDVEARLRRDALDFLHALVRDQGGPSDS